MGNQIIKQPDGKYSVFSSNTDGFIATDATKDEIIDWLIESEKVRITQKVNNICQQLEEGGKPYFEFTMSYDEAKKEHERNYGPI